MANVDVSLEIVNGGDRIAEGDTFEIEVSFTDVRNLDNLQSVFSGYVDVNFDASLIQVDAISYGSLFGLAQTGKIDNANGVVSDVGATSIVTAPLPASATNPVVTLNVTALQDIPSSVEIATTAAGSESFSQITIFGSDNDQDGVDAGGNVEDGTNFGTLTECFLTGTLISTEEGQRPIETLKIGDRVKTPDGALIPIKWVGHQTYIQSEMQPHPFRTYPILIKAGALGNNAPVRDLYVSPDHALLINELLINAGALTNGSSIVQVTPENDTFVYHNVELENHALLLAEGTVAESYLPQIQGREAFDNYEEYNELYPNSSTLALLPMNYPRITNKQQLPRFVSKQLNKIAYELYPQEATQVA